MYEMGTSIKFSSAHNLREYKGKCERLHGHNYKVEIVVCGENLTNGMLMDFVLLKQHLKDIASIMDHAYLNELEAFREIEPSSENIAKYVYESLKTRLPDNVWIKYSKVWESDDNWAIYTK